MAADGVLTCGLYHSPCCREISLAGATKRCCCSRSHAGGLSEPTHTMVLPLPVMNTAEKRPSLSSSKRVFSSISSGSLHWHATQLESSTAVSSPAIGVPKQLCKRTQPFVRHPGAHQQSMRACVGLAGCSTYQDGVRGHSHAVDDQREGPSGFGRLQQHDTGTSRSYTCSAHSRVKGGLLQVVHAEVWRQAPLPAQLLQQVAPLCCAAPAQVQRFEYCGSGQPNRRLHQQQLCIERQGWLDILHYLPPAADHTHALKRGPAALARVLNTICQAHGVKQASSCQADCSQRLQTHGAQHGGGVADVPSCLCL